MTNNAESPYSFAAFRNRLTVRGTLVALTGLRIGAGRDSDVVGNDLPVLRDVVGRPLIPGASLKGALRAQAEGLIRTVAPEQVRDFVETEKFQATEIEALKNDEDFQGNDRALSNAIWEHSNLIDMTFGAPWVAGRLFLKDALVDEQFWYQQFEVRNGVAINRDTETVEGGMLYDYEVVPAGTRFDFELVLEQAEAWQQGMLLLLLKPWERGEMRVGGFRSRGLGHVRLENVTRTYATMQSVEDVLALLDGNVPDVRDEQMNTWRKAFKDRLTGTPAPQSAGGSNA